MEALDLLERVGQPGVRERVALQDRLGISGTSGTGAGLTTVPSDEAYTGVSVNLTCGEAIAAGDAVYYKSDGKIYKSNAGAIATMPVMGLAMSAGTSAGDTTILILGIYRHDDLYAWGTVGGYVYAWATAGLLSQTQPATADGVVQVVGIATHADRMYVNPQMSYITHT